MSRSIDNSEDVIDSRDVIKRIEELSDRANDEDDPLDEDEAHELFSLRKLASQCEGDGDWEHGAALVHDDHFTEHAREEFTETGDVSKKELNRWPFTCIDWDQAAQELQQDYTSVDFDGVTYWMRS